MNAILLAGQSIMDRLWQTASTGEPSPASNTYMWSSGAWIAPVNSLIQLTNRLASNTGREVRVFPAAQEGAALFQAGANTGTPTWWWLNEVDSTSPLVQSLAMMSASGAKLSAVVFLEGQGETRPAVNMTPELYQAGLCKLHAILAIANGCSPDQLPFIIIPLAEGDTRFPAVSRAQYTAGKFPGMMVGPEYWDLPQDASDLPHLNQSGRDTLALRIADYLTPIVGVSPTPVRTKVGSFTMDCSSSANQSVSGIGFAPKSVRFIGALNGSKAMSVGLDDGATAGNIRDIATSTPPSTEGQYGVSSGWSISMIISAGNYCSAKVSSLDSDGFTLAKLLSGSPAGTATVIYEATG